MKLDKILTYLKCPYCAGKKLFLISKEKIGCDNCGKKYSVIEGIPILVKEEYLGKQERKQIKWYENHYSRFSDHKYQLENWRLSMLKRIFDKECLGKVNTYLDIGCGATGYTVIEAARRNNWVSFGVDISLEAMVRAKRLATRLKVDQKTAFVVCSAETLPFRDNLFDYASAVSVLEHIEDDEKVIASVSKILKKKGKYFICAPNTYRRMWPFLWPIYFYIDKDMGHKRHYSIEELNQKLEKYGFKNIKIVYNAHLIKLMQMILEKIGLMNERLWWKMENNDLNLGKFGLQLNSIYEKT